MKLKTPFSIFNNPKRDIDRLNKVTYVPTPKKQSKLRKEDLNNHLTRYMHKQTGDNKIICRYLGELHTEALHERSGYSIKTDAPRDHAGKGESFSPTDLLATALGTCFLTVMGITAKEKGWKLGEVTIEVDKTMNKEGPRKIEALSLQIKLPPGLSDEQIKVLQEATRDCPVLRNLKDSMKININWRNAKKRNKTFLKFLPTNIFRETPQVTFFDAGVKGSNGSDVVIHHGNAISPPNENDCEQFYVHQHQIDHNLVLDGSRTFTLLNPAWDEPHHIIFLNKRMGALQIPIGTYHRSVSGPQGSMVLNQAVRDRQFDPTTEFIPVSLSNRADLRQAKEAEPVLWVYEEGQIKRVKIDNLSIGDKGSTTKLLN